MIFKKAPDGFSLPLFASEKFLSLKSNEYGWFVHNDLCLPYYVSQKLFFTYITIPHQTVFSNDTVSIEKEKKFLTDVISWIRKDLKHIDFILQPPTNVLFNTYPEGAVYCPFGSYRIDLTLSEETLFSNLHVKHRNVIRKAMKASVEIHTGSEYKEIALKLTQETMSRQGMSVTDTSDFLKESKVLQNNIEYFVAIHNGSIQGAAIIYWDRNSAYYIHGGSILKPFGGSLNLMHWNIILNMKRNDVKTYDFVGARITPEKGSKLEGIQRFKSRFGSVMHDGYLWKYPIKPFKYNLYRNLQKLNSFRKRQPYKGDIIDQESR